MQNGQERIALVNGVIPVEEFYKLRRHVSQVVLEKDNGVESPGLILRDARMLMINSQRRIMDWVLMNYAFYYVANIFDLSHVNSLTGW